MTSSIGDALEAMHRAHLYDGAFVITATVWGVYALMDEAYKRWELTQYPGSVVSFELDEQPGPERFDRTRRYFGEPSKRRWREERFVDNVPVPARIVSGGTVWHGEGFNMRTSMQYRSDVLPEQILDVLDPSAAVGLLTLSLMDTQEPYLGRRVYRLHAAPRWLPGPESSRNSWFYADEHQLVIDSEHGFMLDYVAFLHSKPMAGTRVDSLALPRHLDDSMFVLPE